MQSVLLTDSTSLSVSGCRAVRTHCTHSYQHVHARGWGSVWDLVTWRADCTLHGPGHTDNDADKLLILL